MKIEINIEKKHAFMILGAILILAVCFFVYAYNPNPNNPGKPSIMGHSVDEIDWSKQIRSNLNISGNVSVRDVCLASGKCLSNLSSINYVGVNCLVENIIVENRTKYGRAMGFNDEGGGNDFYVCCRDKKIIFFGYGGRSYSNQRCDEFGNVGVNATGLPL